MLVVVVQCVERQFEAPITIEGVGYSVPKFIPDRVIEPCVIADIATLLGASDVTTFESNVNALSRVPVMDEIVTLIRLPVPIAAEGWHLTSVSVVHEVVMQPDCMTDIVGVIEYTAKLSPLIVTVEPAVTPRFELLSEITGESNVNPFVLVPTWAETVTVICFGLLESVAPGFWHVTVDVVTHETEVQPTAENIAV